MTKVPKKKHIVQELSSCLEDRIPEENERIVRVICGRGNDLHEVKEIGKDDDSFLVTMPGRFRKTLWVKRGDYLIVTDIPESGDSSKVKAEISEILTKKRIKFLKVAGLWPEIEDTEDKPASSDDEIWVNTNRKNIPGDESTSDEEDD